MATTMTTTTILTTPGTTASTNATKGHRESKNHVRRNSVCADSVDSTLFLFYAKSKSEAGKWKTALEDERKIVGEDQDNGFTIPNYIRFAPLIPSPNHYALSVQPPTIIHSPSYPRPLSG